MNQYNKILKLYENSEWVCQQSFWDSYIRSPHKRRGEMKKLGYDFEPRPCEHGIKRSNDYKLVKVEPEKVQETKEIKVEQVTQGVLYTIPESQRRWTL